MLDVDQREAAREATAPLDLTFDITRVRGELLAWAGVLLTAASIRLAALESFALRPDGARRAFAAFSLLIGGEGAGLAGADGGPFATLFGALLFFLFGVTDAIARLGPALAGIGVVAATLWLRPFLGRAGALLAGLLLAISPSFAFFSRLVQPDIYAAFFALLLFIALLRLAEWGRRGDLILAAAAAALLFVSAPVGPTLLLLLLALGGAALAGHRGRGAAAGEGGRADDEFIVERDPAARGGRADERPGLDADAWPLAALVALGIALVVFSAFGARPGDLLTGPADHLAAWLRSLRGPDGVAPDRTSAFAPPGRTPIFALGLLPLYEPLALLAGFWAIARLLTGDADRAAEASRGGVLARTTLAVWAVAGLVLLAFGGARQPGHILLPALPLTLLAGAALGDFVAGIEWGRRGWFWRGGGWLLALVAILALAAWGATLGALFRADARAIDGREWLVRIVLTLFLFALPLTAAALALARSLRAARGGGARAARALALAGVALLAAYGLRSAIGLSISRPDSANEPLVYEVTTRNILPLADRVRRLSRDLTGQQVSAEDPTGGHGLPVALDPAVEWPLRWYLRDFTALEVGPVDQTPPRRPGAPQVVFRPVGGAPLPPGAYVEQRARLRWSYPAGAPLVGGGENGLQRLLRFLLFRDNVAQAPATELIVGYAPDLAQRVGLAPPAAALGPFALGERAGQGRAPGQFNQPRGVALGRDGALYVVDLRNARVQQFSREGAFVRQFGAPGRGDGQFLYEGNRGPTGIATDAEGFVYVADTWNFRIQKFTAEGQFVAKWGAYANLVNEPPVGNRTGFYGPRGIAISAAGEVYVTDTGNGRVLVFDREGAFLREFGAKGAGPDQLNEPVGIAVSADGSRVYVADSNNGRISLFDPAGRPLAQWPVEAWRGKAYFEPYLALDAEGNLYATSSTTKQILLFDRDGRLVTASGGAPPDDALAQPIGLAVAPDRTLYVADMGRNAVLRLAPLAAR